ncbi:glycoside hydrolase family 44 protein [Fimbriimonas ginsengisoli]|uniref:glycoside hydrolase family 44 protein n=1 Tax=Fimbriimonas ginsengisoli TaxID=1005039 RepID=UPI00130D847C|nr:glycoside hydrolase family 44 protein [Fimbriimonas ginsengisoli]
MKARSLPTTRLVIAILAAAHPLAGFAQTVISVNVQANRHPINPNIYGTAWATQVQLGDLNAPINRYGGNNSSRYNWNLNADNRGSDWFFQSIADTSSVAGERGDTIVGAAKNVGVQAMITIPMVPYIAKLGANRGMIWSFSKAKYGNQTNYDPWHSDSGNGVSAAAGNPYITGNDPLDANVANSPATQTAWVNHLISKWGASNAGGVKYYIMDNEPSLWNSTHRDVHPAGETYDELFNAYKTYALGIRNADPNALIVGPEEWGWTGYFFSGADAAYGSSHGWGGPFPDKTAHSNMDHVPWLLKTLKAYQTSSGKQLLNVFSLHYYPQQGEFGDDDSAGMRAIRNRSTRSLWDPSYTDTSWIGSNVQLIPRMKSWVSTYYPGLQTAITEYNWGDESQLNGATTQADIYGIFGREGLDMGARWGTPDTKTPTYLAMKIYRNYDGAKSTFGDTSVGCTVPNPDNLSAFAAEKTADGSVRVMVINKLASAASIRIDLSNFSSADVASSWQISSATQTSINHLADVSVKSNSLATTVPAQSITLYVFAKATTGPQYDFEANTQSWGGSGAPISSVAWSTAQHSSGTHSLAVNLNGAAGAASVVVANPTTPAGKTVIYHVWIPTGSKIKSVQAWVMQPASGNNTFTGTIKTLAQLTAGAWNTITVTVPANAKTPLAKLGVQFVTSATWTGTCYVDAISW